VATARLQHSTPFPRLGPLPVCSRADKPIIELPQPPAPVHRVNIPHRDSNIESKNSKLRTALGFGTMFPSTMGPPVQVSAPRSK